MHDSFTKLWHVNELTQFPLLIAPFCVISKTPGICVNI